MSRNIFLVGAGSRAERTQKFIFKKKNELNKINARTIMKSIPLIFFEKEMWYLGT